MTRATPTTNKTTKTAADNLVVILLSNLAKATEPDLRARLIAAIARLRAEVER